MEIKAVLSDNKTLLIYDVTSISYPLNQTNIWAIDLTISSAYIPATVLIDVFNYMNTVRKEREMCIITSDYLGLSPGLDIPDGTYTLKFLINNTELIEEKLVVISAIRDKITAVAKELDYEVLLNNVVINKQLEDNAKKLVYLGALYNKLLIDISINIDEKETNNAIDKFNRILELWN